MPHGCVLLKWMEYVTPVPADASAKGPEHGKTFGVSATSGPFLPAARVPLSERSSIASRWMLSAVVVLMGDIHLDPRGGMMVSGSLAVLDVVNGPRVQFAGSSEKSRALPAMGPPDAQVAPVGDWSPV